MPVKLEYALKHDQKEGGLFHVLSVENGLACQCVCPHCGARLIARNKATNKVAPHFQHYQSVECGFAVETSLHLLAKEVLDEIRQIMLPGYKERFVVKDKKYRGYGPLYDEEKEFLLPELSNLERVELEKPVDNIRPDLIVWVNGEAVFVEVYVTHKVDQTKLHIIKIKGTAAIELDLHALDRTITKDELKALFLNGQYSKWIYHPSVELAKQDFELELSQIVRDEEQWRDEDFAVVKKKRELKKHRIEYLNKAKVWIRPKTAFQIKVIEDKYGWSLFRRINENWVVGCPIMRSPAISKCLFCDYNPKFDSGSTSRFLRQKDMQIGYVQCLHDLMRDRYFHR